MNSTEEVFGMEQLDEELDFLTLKTREVVPVECCPHADPPCLGCALQWLVNQSVPVSLTPPEPIEDSHEQAETETTTS